MTDIYGKLKKRRIRKVEKPEVEASTSVPIVVKVPMPEVQKVQVMNKSEPKVYPQTQDVKIVNADALAEKIGKNIEIPAAPEAPKIEIPDTVKIENVDDLAEKIASKIVIPSEVKVSNPTPAIEIPVNKGDIPGKADPQTYVPVRLTNGKNFYQAQTDSYVAAAKQSFPFVDVNGKPKQVQMDVNGNLPVSATVTPAADQQVHITPGVTTAVSGSLTVTSVSGSPTYGFQTNIPTIQSVREQNPITTITTLSGSATDVKNFPTVQTVAVQSMPTVTAQLSADGVTTAVSGNVTTLSGSVVDIKNFPTVFTTNVQNLPNVTSISGQNLHVFVDNLPTIQTVSDVTVSGLDHVTVDNLPTVQTVRDNSVTISGLQHTLVDNFPTAFTANIQNMPAVTGSVTTLSGSIVDVKNFPTVMSVQPQGITTISGQAGVTVAVSGTVTTVSGFHVTVDNFPTIHKVSIADLPNITTASGSIVDVKNFPTVQTVNVNNVPNVQITPGITTAVSGSLSLTTTSGSPMNVFETNIPTVQTVNLQLGGVNQSGANVVDTSNSALKVNVVAGGAGGGVADTQVRDIAGAWHDVGYRAGTDVNMPVAVQAGAVAVSGTVAHGTADTGGPVKIGGYASNNAPAAVSDGQRVNAWLGDNGQVYVALTRDDGTKMATGDGSSDAKATNASAYYSLGYNLVYNPVTGLWDRMRGDSNNGLYVQLKAGTTVSGSVTTLSGSATDVKNFPTIQTVNVQNMPSIPTGTNSIGAVTSTSGTLNATITNFPTVQTVRDNSVTISGLQHTVVDNFPTTSYVKLSDGGGNLMGVPTNPVVVSGTNTGWLSTTFSGLATAGGATTIKATGGTFGGYAVYNPNSSVTYLQVFQDSSVTVGTTNPIFVIGIPATSAANLIFPLEAGRQCPLAIKIAATTTAKGGTPPTIGIDGTLFYN